MPDGNRGAVIPYVNMCLAEMERLAVAMARSQLFGIKTPEQALALMAISQAEGRHPALAARDYDIINNRPSKKAEAMARDFLEGGGKIEWKELTDERAEASFSHPDGGTVTIAWDIERAKQAGLYGKQTWKQYPRQMLRSRVVSEGIRTVYPLATSGMYVPEEVRDFDNRPMRDVTPPAEEAPPSEAAKIVEETRNILDADTAKQRANQLRQEVRTAIDRAMFADELDELLLNETWRNMVEAIQAAADADTAEVAINQIRNRLLNRKRELLPPEAPQEAATARSVPRRAPKPPPEPGAAPEPPQETTARPTEPAVPAEKGAAAISTDESRIRSSTDEAEYEITPPLWQGKPDYRTWLIALFLPKLKQQTDMTLPFFLGDNQEQIAAAQKVLAADDRAQLERAIEEAWERV